jgi:excisionase family DNA binding protein
MQDPSITIELLTVDEAAELMKVSSSTVYRLIYEGKLPAVRIGRLRRIMNVDLAEYLKSLRGDGR